MWTSVTCMISVCGSESGNAAKLTAERGKLPPEQHNAGERLKLVAQLARLVKRGRGTGECPMVRRGRAAGQERQGHQGNQSNSSGARSTPACSHNI